MTESPDGPTSPIPPDSSTAPAESTPTSADPPPWLNGSGPPKVPVVGGPAAVNGSAVTGGPINGAADHPAGEVDAEQIGTDLIHRLDTLDDRLQRSQEKMIALLDRKLGDGGDAPSTQPSGRSPDPDHQRWAPPPPGSPRSFEAAHNVAADDPMETWFNAAPPKAADPFLADPSVAFNPEARQNTEPASGTGWANPAAGASEVPVTDETEPAAATAPPSPSAVTSEIVPARRPAWQSNLITVAVSAVVLVVALFLVGLF